MAVPTPPEVDRGALMPGVTAERMASIKAASERVAARRAASKHTVDVSGNDPEMEVLAQPGSAKPMVTTEQYAQARAVLDALPAGVYLHCSGCKRWQRGGDIRFGGAGVFLCERCTS